MNERVRLLLTCNSPGDEIVAFLGRGTEVLTIPYASPDWDDATQKNRDRLDVRGLRTRSIHTYDDPKQALETCSAVYISGGNAFLLLKALYDLDLLRIMRRRIRAGEVRFVGSSAGASIASPTIHCVNDMPLVEPPSFIGLGIVPYYINVHFPESGHAACTTREREVAEFHSVHDVPVVGLRIGGVLVVDGHSTLVIGTRGARLFQSGQPSITVPPGDLLENHLQVTDALRLA
jgi:dipeptidase E